MVYYGISWYIIVYKHCPLAHNAMQQQWLTITVGFPTYFDDTADSVRTEDWSSSPLCSPSQAEHLACGSRVSRCRGLSGLSLGRRVYGFEFRDVDEGSRVQNCGHVCIG